MTNFSYEFMTKYFSKSSGFNYSEYLIMANLAMSHEIDDETRKNFGFNLETSIVDYYFGIENKDINELSWYFNFNNGNCFKVNSGKDYNGKPLPIKSASLSGPDTGFSVIYFSGISEDNKFSYFGNYGARIFIHNSTSDPLPNDGIELEPGKASNIILNKVINKRYPYPYSDCQDIKSFSSDLFDYFISSKKRYSQADCFNLCIQKEINNECKCTYYGYPKFRNFSVCLTQEQYNCYRNVVIRISTSLQTVCSDECPLECDTISYEYTVSSSKFPLKAYAKENGFYTHLPGKNLTYEQVQDSFILINVYFNNLLVTIIEESPSVNALQLVSDIGGTLGLFLGISILSIVEVFELIIGLLVIIFCSKRALRKI